MQIANFSPSICLFPPVDYLTALLLWKMQPVIQGSSSKTRKQACLYAYVKSKKETEWSMAILDYIFQKYLLVSTESLSHEED